MLDRRVVVRTAIAGAGTLAVLALLVGVANAIVLLGGGAKTDPRSEPHAQAALVLGAFVGPDGRPHRGRCAGQSRLSGLAAGRSPTGGSRRAL